MAKSKLPAVGPGELLDPVVLPANVIRQLAPVFEVSTTGMAHLLGMSRHAVWRRIHRQQALPGRYQVRAMGAIRLYALALNICWLQTVKGRQESRRWLNDWLRTGKPGSGNHRPIELLGSDEGQRELQALVMKIADTTHTYEWSDD
jgi:uncharacterized protein (DUF2384 family)